MFEFIQNEYLNISIIQIKIIKLSVLCRFKLLTLYPSFTRIYIVSHYFKSSAKMLKSSITHTITSKSCS